MPVPSLITDLSATAASNSPSGSEAPVEGDNHLRAAYAFIRQLYDGVSGVAYPTLAQLASTASAADGAGMVGWNGALDYSAQNDDTVGGLLYTCFGRTANEIAAGITPTNYAYPVGHIDRYGVGPGGGVNSSPALQAAINSLGTLGGTVYASAGQYDFATKVTNGLVNYSLRIVGAGMRSTFFRWTGGADIMLDLGTSGANLDNVEVSRLAFENTGSGTVACQIAGFRVYLHRLFSNSPKKFSEAIVRTGASTYIFKFKAHYCDFFASIAGEETPIGLDLQEGHTFVVDTCMTSGLGKGVKLGGGNSITGASVVNSRFESFSGTDPSYPGSATDIGIEAAFVLGLNISGCNFEMAGDQHASSLTQRAVKTIDVAGGKISGNYFSGNGVCTGSIDIANAATNGLAIDGNHFQRVVGYGIVASGGGSLWKQQIGRNSAPSPTTGDWDNSWTPTISFTTTDPTGSAYTAVAKGQRDGDWVTYAIQITYTTKGAGGSGEIRINGAPIASLNDGIDKCGDVMSFGYVAQPLIAYCPAGQTGIRIYKQDTNQLTWADLTGTDFMQINIRVAVAR